MNPSLGGPPAQPAQPAQPGPQPAGPQPQPDPHPKGQVPVAIEMYLCHEVHVPTDLVEQVYNRIKEFVFHVRFATISELRDQARSVVDHYHQTREIVFQGNDFINFVNLIVVMAVIRESED